ncbi:PKD domain-containing protein [Ideonella sp. A 288]|uniref:PKD domain-containing protein n=1 Tax=Ideonella sp. A 288 TaxID=1962181 RepID=UPI000B4A965B|nr:PKD domain-containing protein [Ideonella sp. A 288]
MNTLKSTVLRVLFCTGAVLALPSVQGQALQTPDWQRSTAGASGVAVELDGQDNAYVVGVTAPNAFDANVGTALISRFSSTGVLQWSRTWFPTGYAGVRPTAMFTDAAGAVVVVGAYADYNYAVSNLGSGTTAGPTGVMEAGWVVLKYGSDGTLLWSRHVARASGYAVAGVADAAGDLYVLGRGTNKVFTAEKLSGATGATIWSKNSLAVTGGETPGQIRLTPSNHVVVSGAGAAGMSLYAYAADTGATLWSTRHAAAAGNYAPSLAVGPWGEVIGTGTAGSALFVAAHDASYAPLFARSYPQGTQGVRVGVDALRNIVVSGVAASPTNWVTLRLDAAGNVLTTPWAADYHPTANETPYDLALGSDGSAFVAGATGMGWTVDGMALRATTARYLPNGSVAWLASTLDAAAAVDVAAAKDGAVFVLGNTAQTLLHYPATANQLPVGSLKLGTGTTAPLTVYLDASLSRDADGSVASYRWNFGDGTAATTATPLVTHVYPVAGSYTANVTPVDNVGAVGSTASLVVTATVPVVAPPTPTALTLSSTSVIGGTSLTGTVKASSTAGVVVKLTSSKPRTVAVPSSITIPAGASTGSFTVKTARVTSSTTVAITATANGVSVKSLLTVTR